jgi:ABC-type lipoprotein release transport system permease subunit
MKQLLSSIRIAFRALRMNKLRSALTMLGIVIGVASVIATVAIGSGATQRILRSGHSQIDILMHNGQLARDAVGAQV